MSSITERLNEFYRGKVVRKDLLHQIKKGTNVPSFVLEFLLAKYCASDDPGEIEMGKKAVIETIEKNFVRPDEANKAQSQVQQKGKHKFIDKIHVRYSEKEKRHWAEMENFNSKKIAISEKYYRENERILEGGIWAEVTVAHNDIEEDNYAFLIEDLKPIQLSKFNIDEFKVGRANFTRDEWLDILIRTVGLEPTKLSKRVKFHYLARLFPFIEKNYNFIELGPRGTGKSYFYSEFSPYSTLVSGGQATPSILFYNNARRKVGLVGYWDTIAFDEVGNIQIKDRDAIQIMKDYMANGRFSRGTEVIADASLAFVGNIDYAIEQLVNSDQFDLFVSLPEAFDLAVMDRFFFYLPGWEMPKNSSEFLTSDFGFITDYLAEAFHYLSKKENRYEYVSKRCKLNKNIEGRDEMGIKRTLAALVKMLHPIGDPTDEEFEEYMEYAIEGRRRVKEQMNKRKTDDEYARIDLGFIQSSGKEKIIYCPESKDSPSTQNPSRKTLKDTSLGKQMLPEQPGPATPKKVKPAEEPVISPPAISGAAPKEKHYRIFYGDTGHSYESIFGEYMAGAKSVTVEDPYIRLNHQVANFVRFCEMLANSGTIKSIKLTTGFDDENQKLEIAEKLESLAQSLSEVDIKLDVDFDSNLHDRQVTFSNGWVVKIGRGLDMYQKAESFYAIGNYDQSQRKCLETMVDVFRAK